MDALMVQARFHFHERLFETNTLTLNKSGVASNADTSSRGSIAIACRIVEILVNEHHHTVNTVDKISGQTLGKQFELLTMEFLQETFPTLQNLRPGQWSILQLGNNNRLKTSDFEQYEHLDYLYPRPETFAKYNRITSEHSAMWHWEMIIGMHRAQIGVLDVFRGRFR